jgi:hypothetical protein
LLDADSVICRRQWLSFPEKIRARQGEGLPFPLMNPDQNIASTKNILQNLT